MNRMFSLFHVFNILILFFATSAERFVRKHGCRRSAWISSESDGEGFHYVPSRGRSYLLPNNNNGYGFRLNEPLTVGQTIYILGRISYIPMTINLVNRAPKGDGSELTALHLSFRARELVMNTAENGRWGQEQKIGGSYPHPGPFEIHIQVLLGKFVIYLDRRRHVEFNFRYDLSTVDYLYISPNGYLSEVPIISGRRALIPFNTDFPNHSLKNGESLRVSGVSSKVNNYEINFYNGKGDIMFHCKADFDQKEFRFNSFVDGAWQVEETSYSSPYQRGYAFDLEFANEPTGIEVFYNGNHYHTFKHRVATPTSDYVRFDLRPDFELTELEVCVN